MNDIDKMPSKCRDCPYWELAAEPYVCCDCENPVEKRESDYILRSDALKELYRDASATDPMSIIAYRVDICDRLESIPAADVEPVRRGRWERKPDPYGFFDTIPVCSVCKCTTKYREESLCCPHCGAKMMSDDEIADGIGQTFAPD